MAERMIWLRLLIRRFLTMVSRAFNWLIWAYLRSEAGLLGMGRLQTGEDMLTLGPGMMRLSRVEKWKPQIGNQANSEKNAMTPKRIYCLSTSKWAVERKMLVMCALIMQVERPIRDQLVRGPSVYTNNLNSDYSHVIFALCHSNVKAW